MNIAIVYGGRSGEHEISLISAAAIARAVGENHSVTLIGITHEGKWYLQENAEYERICKNAESPLSITENEANAVCIIPGGGKNALRTAEKTLDIDVAFSALHGTYGEDGTIQGLFEMADIPYVGCSTMSSALTMDKEKTKIIAEAAGIKTVPYICMKRCDLNNSQRYDEIFQRAIDTLGFPLFVKPCCAGSSNGSSKATSPKELSFALMEAFCWDNKVLIEKAINAKEVECSVTGNSVTSTGNETDTVKAYIPGEILPTHTFYDFDAKYNDPDGAKLQIPADLSVDMTETVRSTAVKVYKAMDCSGLSRVDFFIDKDTNELYFNEINTMPGFTKISMFPKMCGAAGLDFPSLANLLIDEAVLQYTDKSNIQTKR